MKIKNIIIYIVVFVMILISFKLPGILLQIEEAHIESKVYEKGKKEKSIDIETEKIYLVKAIHDIEDENHPVEIVVNGNKYFLTEQAVDNNSIQTGKKIDEELLKLKEANIVKKFEIDNRNNYSIGIVNKFYKKEKGEYILYTAKLTINNKEYSLEMENKTGKILSLTLEKDNFNDTTSRKETLEKYINYLDLYMIDDWEYKEDKINKEYSFTSNKADLVANISETSNNFILSIHSRSIHS